MTFMQVVLEFIFRKFPWWGVCHFQFDPQAQTIYIHCQNPDKRAIILKDAAELANLDIGVKRFIVVHPSYSDITIPHIPRQMM